jgi:type II secretory ATPase GspE/PulE/Tfp pilus assembly ATPase PilB-like protein
MHAINTMGKNILTIEDPVEYQLELINQSQVCDALGLSFAHILRSVLRQDPDVIMVGESWDRETAEIAMQAALTGHPVLSTLHTSAMTLAAKAVWASMSCCSSTTR